MNIEYHKWSSPALGQEMELKVFGHAGKPVLVFPAQGGRFFEFEDFGMVAACRDFVERGDVIFYTVDSIDNQSWANTNIPPAERARRHEDYDRYIVQEVVPFMRGRSTPQKFWTTGCSMGGYHSANFLFRHPDLFDGVISLSGLFQLRLFVGDYVDDAVYFNSPLLYLPNLTDAWYLNQYRQSRIVVCAGQGTWEEASLEDMRQLETILNAKQIPAWIDRWGSDVNHDWPWWRKQLPYFLNRLVSQ
jgi:esterase/lipase superfamily enzyme